MIQISEVEVHGWQPAIRGMRNPMNSWEQSDSGWCEPTEDCRACQRVEPSAIEDYHCELEWGIGRNDLTLMHKLFKAGTDHRKFMRFIVCYCDINAPLYWWKEFDTYRFGVEKNSCSTMHKIHSKPIEMSDFSMDNFFIDGDYNEIGLEDMFTNAIADCETLRQKYIETGDKTYWKGLVQLLPTAYNQKRTVMMSYEAIANMYHARKNHKLDEWREFCKWVETLPYFMEIVKGEIE